jgi:hypothetical protein
MNSPIEAQHRKAMNDVAAILDSIFLGYGFALLVFPLNGAEGRMNYISNTERAVNESRLHDAPAKQQ